MSEKFDFIETPLADLYVVRRKPIVDNRGYFTRFFCVDEFEEIGLNQSVVQMNNTFTKKKGTVRGMHYQCPPDAETKLVSCLKGEILDLAVDIRRESPTFLQWHAEILSEENQSGLYIPEGFAHGFQTLTENCEVFYLHTARYKPSSAAGLNAIDPALAIEWPLDVSERSINDAKLAMIDSDFRGVDII